MYVFKSPSSCLSLNTTYSGAIRQQFSSIMLAASRYHLWSCIWIVQLIEISRYGSVLWHEPPPACSRLLVFPTIFFRMVFPLQNDVPEYNFSNFFFAERLTITQRGGRSQQSSLPQRYKPGLWNHYNPAIDGLHRTNNVLEFFTNLKIDENTRKISLPVGLEPTSPSFRGRCSSLSVS